MASTTVLFSVLLIILGVCSYVLTGARSATALIPAIFGVILGVLGHLSRREHLRKHAMHAAAAVALIGMAGALVRLLSAPLGSRSFAAEFSQGAMAFLTALFVVLCIRSFIAARRART